MAHIYMSFDFGTDEEKAQQARHKLEMWKQAFRLDKKMLYKFERESNEANLSEDSGRNSEKADTKSGKAGKAKGKQKAKPENPEVATGNVRLYLRLAFSGHEKMTEENLLKKFPAEEPFSELSSKAVKQGDANFAELEAKFDSLD
ncbi:MAG TPA: hypothetical protein VIW23_06125 [Candidatus Acidoferrum sp.]|jgi:hypothetical protein